MTIQTESGLPLAVWHREAQRGNAAAKVRMEHSTAQIELASARETIKRLSDQLNQVSRTYAQGAVYHAQSRGEELDRLRKALETLADRYHAQRCHCRHKLQDCPKPPPAVAKANAALAGESVDASGGAGCRGVGLRMGGCL